MGIAAGGKQAFLLIEKTSPQFAFVDIQLSDGALRECGRLEFVSVPGLPPSVSILLQEVHS